MRHEIYLAGGCFWGLEMFLAAAGRTRHGVLLCERTHRRAQLCGRVPRRHRIRRGRARDLRRRRAAAAEAAGNVLFRDRPHVPQPAGRRRRQPVPHRRILSQRRGQAGDRSFAAKAAGALRQAGPGCVRTGARLCAQKNTTRSTWRKTRRATAISGRSTCGVQRRC